ncbi:MAG: hypothetical protein JWM64_2463 [Frankiales bacterium]|nr:hypothetical protein [Frankiales bacterium]
MTLLLSDPSIAALPARDCGEPLVDLRTHSNLLLDPRKKDHSGAWARLRSGVLQRLLSAEAELPAGVRLLIIEGHRPQELQRKYFDDHHDDVRRANPTWSESLLTSETSKHVSPPTVAPHPCGAAVDLTLQAEGRELDLGTSVNATPADSEGACFTSARNIGSGPRHWRAVLGRALSSAGLVNYPPGWHWSYGDRYWAAVTSAESALYEPR